jgi:hypothetical protein
VYVDAPAGSAIIGWTITVKVDPNVLQAWYHSPFPPPFGSDIWATGGDSGYFLYDWCGLDSPNPTWPSGTEFLKGALDKPTGTITGITEGLVGWRDVAPGDGASGTGKLATLYFTSLSETGYSTIEIVDALYYTSLDNPSEIPDQQVPEIVNGNYNEPPLINMIGHSAWPERKTHYVNKHGDDITLFARIRNDGPTTAYGKVVYTITSASGPIIPPPETAPIELTPGDKAVIVNVTWALPGYDKYYVTARVYVDADGNLATLDWMLSLDKPKLFHFNVKP